MELEWKEPIQIQDGKHSGEITKIEYRHEPYEYTDVLVKLDGVDIELRYGCPSVLSENSKLGRLLQAFGTVFEKGKKSDPEAVLKGKRIQCMTITKKSKKSGKRYSEIVEDSLKPEGAE